MQAKAFLRIAGRIIGDTSCVLKKGVSPSINQEHDTLKKLEKNRKEEAEGVYDYVTGIDYRGESINMIEYEDAKEGKRFQFVTNLGITWKNVKGTVERGRWRWKIENEGFNTQKKTRVLSGTQIQS